MTTDALLRDGRELLRDVRRGELSATALSSWMLAHGDRLLAVAAEAGRLRAAHGRLLRAARFAVDFMPLGQPETRQLREAVAAALSAEAHDA